MERTTPAAPSSSPPRLVWLNGLSLPADGPHVSALDRGFTLADGVFETMRVYGGHAFRLDEHLARMAHGAEALGIAPPPLDAARAWVAAALRAAAGAGWADAAALRLTLTRGAGAVGVAPPPTGATPSTCVLTAQPLPHFPASLYREGLAACVASGTRNERAMSAGLKTLAYTDAVLALAEARRAGADEAIFLDSEGHCSEATSSNLFAWTGAELLTPPPGCGALPGITRAAVISLARDMGLSVAERPFGLPELRAAREIFLTSSLRELAPVVRIEGQPIGDGVPGPVTRQLTHGYAALVRRECAGGDDERRP